MSFGKLYGFPDNPRTKVLLVVAKANNLKLDLVDTNPGKGVSDDYRKLNKLGRIPTFEGKDGYTLSEAMAIAIYLTSQNEKTTLLGKTKQDYASILRWMSYANTELLSSIGGAFRPLVGRDPYNKKNVDDNLKAMAQRMKVVEDHLMINTYLVSERLTLADIFVASILGRGFEHFFDKDWRAANPSVTRWYETITNQGVWTDVAPKAVYIDKARANQPPKKEEKPKQEQPKKQEKKKAVEEDDDDEDDKPAAPKAKHPLEALAKPTFVLDDWKRKYSNEDTREVALPWFWSNMNFDEYSLWTVDYKYNDELTQTFMTSNLIGGFFARLEASRKYLFGCASVFGVKDDSIIKGAFLVRGQEAEPAFDVAPDYESYEFKKLDPKSEADRAFVDDMWSWDKPVDVGGKKYEWADGKQFK